MLSPADIERLEATPFALPGSDETNHLGPQCTAICSFMPTRLSYNIICPVGPNADLEAQGPPQCTAICSFMPSQLSFNICLT